MSAFVACRGSRLCLPVIAFVLVAAAPALAAGDPEPMTVHIDQAKVLKLPERTATLVVGNPLIADAVVQPGGMAVVTAKSYGATNFVSLDKAGNTLVEYSVQVVGPEDKTVVVYRGANRETYSCVQNCEQRITVGDVPTYFSGTLTQVGAMNALAQPK
jgi:hypothetical protein